MKKLASELITMLFLISGCTFNVQILTPEPPQSTPLPLQTVTSPAPSIPTPISPTVEPTFTPTTVPPTTYPVFNNARVGASPEDPTSPNSFPAGIQAVYAIWEYQNMREGLVVKREWYWNGQPWITREEPWDFKKYGASGTVRDISIYDNETGLNSGVYQLRLYIDNVLQPISPGIGSPVVPWITFKIGSDESYSGYASPDYKSAVEVFGGKRIVLQNANGSTREIYTAREVPYVSWFPDGSHFLFVDRDRSAQKPTTTIGIRDDLWLVNVPDGSKQLLYESETSFTGRSGPLVSPDGRYIASLEGSGFGDACLVDTHLTFFELASDLRSIRVIHQDEFSGLPVSPDGVIYPSGDGFWQDENTYRVTLNGTCISDQSRLGPYLFNIPALSGIRTGSSQTLPAAGDLGWGIIHGKVTDAVTGAPIAAAAVRCEHSSYTSPATCSAIMTTNPDGTYVFENIFFHDTDIVKLTVQATGYQPEEISQTAFTTNDMEANIALNPVQ